MRWNVSSTVRVCALGTVLALGGLASTGCQSTDPAKPETWVSRLQDKDSAKVVEAVGNLRKLAAKQTAAQVSALLKHEDGEVREAAAAALAEFGDPSVVSALAAAINPTATGKGADRANAKICETLGALGDKQAVPALQKALAARQDTIRLAAVKALGALGDPASAADLTKLVDDASQPPLITKEAIIALGNMRAASAVTSLVKAMVVERPGVSFFAEASYALFQIGASAAPALRGVVDGSDKAFAEWAASTKRLPAGYLSKATIVLADLGDAASAPAIAGLMKWEDAQGQEMMTQIVRQTAAEALGRLRASAAAPAIAANLSVSESNVREKYATALAWIGDTAAVPKLEVLAKDAKSNWTARAAAITGLGLAGGAKQLALVESIAAVETPDEAVKHCIAEESMDEGEAKAARCEKERTSRPRLLTGEVARLKAAQECGTTAACWTGKLKDAAVQVRERAAYELGKSGDVSVVPALVAAAKDPEVPARRAAFIALDWMLNTPAGRPAVVAQAATLVKQLVDEKTQAKFVIVNEDLKRIVWKAQHD